MTGLLTATGVGLGAQPSYAVPVKVGVDDNVYPAIKDRASTLTSGSADMWTFNASGEVGGWWHGDMANGTPPPPAPPPPPHPPTGVTGPGGYCANHVTGSASAHASQRTMTTYETAGASRGPHVWTAGPVAAYGYYCDDGRSRVFVDLNWDTTSLFSTSIAGQYQVARDSGTGAAGSPFAIAPGTSRQCCWQLASLPQVDVGPSTGLLGAFAVQPLTNTSPSYPYSLVDTTGGLEADFVYGG